MDVNIILLLGTDSEGKTAWHLAAEWGNLDTLQKVWEYAEEKLTTQEKNNNLLLGTECEGKSAWHLAADWGNLDTLQKVWEYAEEKLTRGEINNKIY